MTAAAGSTMGAVWFDDGRAEYRPEVAVPERPGDWALIRVQMAGVCGTDRQLLQGYAGFRGIPGHEFVGAVVEGSDAWTGKRVVADINVGCGDCAACSVSAHHCSARRVLGIRGLGGAFAEFLVLPEANLVEVPHDVDDDAAALAEPVAAALHVVDDVPPDADQATVVGDGALGQLTAQALAAHGLHTLVVGRHDRKLQRLRNLGIAVTTRPADVQPGPLVVDCTGTPSGLNAALDLTAPRGTLVLKSTHSRPHELDVAALVVNERRLVGSRCGDVRGAIDALATGRIDIRGLVNRVYSREELPGSFAEKDAAALKTLVRSGS